MVKGRLEWEWRWYVSESGVDNYRIACVWSDRSSPNLIVEGTDGPMRLATDAEETAIKGFVVERLPHPLDQV